MSERYAVIFKCMKVRTLVDKGDTLILAKCEWIDATSTSYNPENISTNTKTFESKEDAEKFFKGWRPHPWYCRPYKNQHQVIELSPLFERQTGWKINATH